MSFVDDGQGAHRIESQFDPTWPLVSAGFAEVEEGSRRKNQDKAAEIVQESNSEGKILNSLIPQDNQ